MRIHAWTMGCALAAISSVAFQLAPVGAADSPAENDPFGGPPAPAAADPFADPAPAPAPKSAPSSNPFPLIRVLPRKIPTPAQLQSGRELFEHRWQVGADRGNDGDGLGPVYNAESCAACHRQGGLGGGGANEHDVELVTRSGGSGGAKAGFVLRHAGLDKPGTILLHARGTDPNYEKLRLSLTTLPLGGDDRNANGERRVRDRLAQENRAGSAVRILKQESVVLRITRRNTPSLFGLGVIDRIDGNALVQEAARQKRVTPGTAGRIASSNPEFDDAVYSKGAQTVRVGKFGWRGQIGTLQEFVLSACANELGLETPGHSQPANPLKRDGVAPGLDINWEQCGELTSFVASLPRPEQELLTDPREIAVVARGEQRFAAIGCADCHRPQLGDVSGIYSDLLLHNMGVDLADPVPANPPVPPGTPASALSSYYGGGIQFAGNRPVQEREWKTPPLWGVRDTAPYLHDGRAVTLVQAIALHGGQGTASRYAFERLPPSEREDLLAFLGSLAAPGEAADPPSAE